MIQAFFFPSLCLHCEEEAAQLLCSSCFKLCEPGLKEKGKIGVFKTEGPILTLKEKLKTEDKKRWGALFASFLFVELFDYSYEGIVFIDKEDETLSTAFSKKSGVKIETDKGRLRDKRVLVLGWDLFLRKDMDKLKLYLPKELIVASIFS